MGMFTESINRTFLLIAIGLMISLWLLINGEFEVGIMYFMIAIGTVFIYGINKVVFGGK